MASWMKKVVLWAILGMMVVGCGLGLLMAGKEVSAQKSDQGRSAPANFAVIKDLESDATVRAIERSQAWGMVVDRVIFKDAAIFTVNGKRYTMLLAKLRPSSTNATGMYEVASFWYEWDKGALTQAYQARRLSPRKGSDMLYLDLLTNTQKVVKPEHPLAEYRDSGSTTPEDHCYNHCYWSCVLLCLIGAPGAAPLCGPICMFNCLGEPSSC